MIIEKSENVDSKIKVANPIPIDNN